MGCAGLERAPAHPCTSFAGQEEQTKGWQQRQVGLHLPLSDGLTFHPPSQSNTYGGNEVTTVAPESEGCPQSSLAPGPVSPNSWMLGQQLPMGPWLLTPWYPMLC